MFKSNTINGAEGSEDNKIVIADATDRYNLSILLKKVNIPESAPESGSIDSTHEKVEEDITDAANSNEVKLPTSTSAIVAVDNVSNDTTSGNQTSVNNTTSNTSNPDTTSTSATTGSTDNTTSSLKESKADNSKSGSSSKLSEDSSVNKNKQETVNKSESLFAKVIANNGFKLEIAVLLICCIEFAIFDKKKKALN